MNISGWKVGCKSALATVVVFLTTASFLYIVILEIDLSP